MGDGSYRLDSAELDLIIHDLTVAREHMQQRVSDLKIQLRRLHSTWDGVAAEAQLVAQAEIDDGLDAMNAALAASTLANQQARDGYQVVWDANVALWAAVSP